jgi:enoyl-CoA hydratase/carnithine racemase
MLTIQREGGALTLTLNRAEKRNALSRALRQEIVSELSAAAKDTEVRAVVLTGDGPVFCAGFDRSEFASEGGMAEVFAEANEYHHRIYTFPKPLIAAVNGPALGGGCDLVAMCDFRLAAPSTLFGQPQVRFGAAAAYELMRTVMPDGAAREMCLSGRLLNADEALRIGLVNRIVSPAELVGEANRLAMDLATMPEDMPESTKRGFIAQQPPLFES